VPSGIVSWWTGDGNVKDRAGTNDAQLVGAVSFVPGAVGEAFQFDSTDYVQASSAGLPTGAADRTMELWARIDTVSALESFFAGYGAFGTANEVYALFAGDVAGVSQPGSEPGFSQWTDGEWGPSVSVGAWHHIAVTNVGGLATLYVDGAVVASKTMAIATASGTPLYMGRIPGSIGDIRKLIGAVDEVSIYSRALTANEIAAIHAAGSGGKCKGSAPPGDGGPPNDASSNGMDSGNAVDSGVDSGGNPGNCTTTYQGSCLTAVGLSAGLGTSFALMSDHSVYGWGSNTQEAVGNVGGDQYKPVRLPGVANIAQISAYFNHTCAAAQTGAVLCWGTQTNGELGEGQGAPATGGSAAPVTVAGVSSAVQVASGGAHTCAVDQGGAVWCWGDNEFGQLAQPQPATGNFTTAVQVPGLGAAAHVVAGDTHTCALLRSGTVSCWGNNASGQLGDGTTTNRFAPTDVGLTGVVEVEAGAFQTCARQSNGAISCWGDDSVGELGDGVTLDGGMPNHVTPQGLAGVQAMALGFYASSATAGGQVYFFGSNTWDVFGTFPSPPAQSSTPVAGTLLGGGSSVVLGRTHACGIFGTQVKCWGSALLGNGMTAGEAIPQVVVWQ
jgi:alpha-tubulin suppressor-like RCC1 family protein